MSARKSVSSFRRRSRANLPLPLMRNVVGRVRRSDDMNASHSPSGTTPYKIVFDCWIEIEDLHSLVYTKCISRQSTLLTKEAIAWQGHDYFKIEVKI